MESLLLAQNIAAIRAELGCGVLLVEHDMRIIFRVCERIQVLDYGKSLAVGSPDEIRRNKRVIAAYLGQRGAEIAEVHQHAEDH
jgi:branched-chain amino acid transport system ATP-binding protein